MNGVLARFRTSNNQGDPWRWNHKNNVLACFRVFNRVSSNEANSPMEMNRCRGLFKEGEALL
eukprot:3076404-Pyramimonas_sp.AAC.1